MKKFLTITMLVIGLTLLSYGSVFPFVMNNFVTPNNLAKAHEQANALTEQEMQANLDRLKELDNQDDLFDFSQVSSITELEPNTTIDLNNVIGGLYIPNVDIQMPILYGATHENMLNGVGTLKSNMTMGEGNYSVAGHNHPNPDLMLAPLKKMKKGDVMYITDKQTIYKYVVDSIEVVMPERVDVLNETEGKNELTIVSCYSDDGHDRIIVKGELTETIPYTDANQELLGAFNDIGTVE